MWVACAIGLAMRYLLYAAGAGEYLEDHLEVNSPITSHVRLKEGLFLLGSGFSPYAGDACHHPPLVLLLLAPLRDAPVLAHLTLVAAVDVATALLLRLLATQYATARARAGRLWAEASEKLAEPGRESGLPAGSSLHWVSPDFVGLSYLLSPFTVASCLALSLQNVQHLFLCGAICLAGSGRGSLSAGAFALVLYICPWTPLVLLPACAYLSYAQKANPKQEDYIYTRSKEGVTLEFDFLAYLLRFTLVVFVLFACLIGSSLAAMGGQPHFLQAAFLSVLTVRDLTPNVGIFWYIFIEIFDRYRKLFLVAFHAQLLFYPAPLHLRVGRHRPVGPFLHCAAAIGILTLFKPYPTVSDHSLMISVLLIQAEIIREAEKLFAFLLSGLLFGLIMFPTMTSVWLSRNAGNANFLYNMTLVVNVFASLLISEWLRASMKLRRRTRIAAYCRGLVLDAAAAAIDGKAESAQPYAQFVVSLDRTAGTKLGINIEMANDIVCISTVMSDGLVPDWNMSHPSAVIKPLDRIVAVCGVSGNGMGMIDQMEQNKVLEVTIARSSQEARRPTGGGEPRGSGGGVGGAPAEAPQATGEPSGTEATTLRRRRA